MSRRRDSLGLFQSQRDKGCLRGASPLSTTYRLCEGMQTTDDLVDKVVEQWTAARHRPGQLDHHVTDKNGLRQGRGMALLQQEGEDVVEGFQPWLSIEADLPR